MWGYFRILAAIPGFFLSSFILMLPWGVIAPKIGPGYSQLSRGNAGYHHLVAGSSTSNGRRKARLVQKMLTLDTLRPLNGILEDGESITVFLCP